MAVWL